MTEWEWLTIASRWFVYLGMSAAIGGAASLRLMARCAELLPLLRRYTLIGALLGLGGVGIHFLIRVGALAEQGFTGLFDPLMLQILWQSSVGDALIQRTLGFVLLVSALMPGRLAGSGWAGYLSAALLALPGGLLIAFSYSQTGHVAGLDSWAALALALHVILTAWWMGSLVPLWLALRRLPVDAARRLLERFGEIAVAAVLLLVAAGALLSYRLTGWQGLLDSDYGFWLLLKLALVGVILLLAACHKFWLVPALQTPHDGGALKRSLLAEKVVGVSILAVTTVLTTLVGPMH